MKEGMVGVLLAALLVLTSCGGGKYADVKSAMDGQMKAMDRFSEKIDKAENSEQVVAALDEFGAKMEKFAREFPKLQEKYPELGDKQNPPEELKETMNQMEGVAQRFMGAMMKVAQQYGEDAQVQEKLQQMQGMMQTGK